MRRREIPVLPGSPSQSSSRTPRLKVRPANGAQASTTRSPVAAGCGSSSGSCFVCRTSVRLIALKNTEIALAESIELDVGSACGAIRVVVQRLLSRIRQFQAHATAVFVFEQRGKLARPARNPLAATPSSDRIALGGIEKSGAANDVHG